MYLKIFVAVEFGSGQSAEPLIHTSYWQPYVPARLRSPAEPSVIIKGEIFSRDSQGAMSRHMVLVAS